MRVDQVGLIVRLRLLEHDLLVVRKMSAYCHRISFYRGEVLRQVRGEQFLKCAPSYFPKCAFFELGTT